MNKFKYYIGAELAIMLPSFAVATVIALIIKLMQVAQ
jgi:hypothetical protein